MTEELLKKLHTAMRNDNEHQCNRLNNYIHTDEYLTAEVVKVVREIVTEATKELQEENRQLKNDYEMIHNCFLISENEKKNLEKQIEKMKCLFEELVIALSTMKNGEKYNVSLLADARKLLSELKEN